MTVRKRFSGNSRFHHHNGYRFQTVTVYIRDGYPKPTWLAAGILCMYCGYLPNERVQQLMDAVTTAKIQGTGNSYPIITLHNIKNVGKPSHTVIE